jgi:nuclear pore complex protein Nup205
LRLSAQVYHEGKIVVNGKSIAVNSDFARQAIFLSQQLDCSERYVAGLLHTIMSENPNIGPVNCLEMTVAEFHHRRRHLVESLRYIFEAAEISATSEAPPLYARINAFAQEELLQVVGDESLASRILKEIENLGSVILRVQTERQNAGSFSSNQGM